MKVYEVLLNRGECNSPSQRLAVYIKKSDAESFLNSQIEFGWDSSWFNIVEIEVIE